MKHKNIVFIAKSLDGYIAGKKGELDWLNSIPNPENIDMGFVSLINRIDAIVMGKTTFETVCRFEGEWSYNKHVFVLSSTLNKVPEKLKEKTTLLNGSVKEILNNIHKRGFFKLYIDGGRTVQNFLKEDLVDELIITTIPILLGGGFSLFNVLPKPLKFNHIKTEVFLNQVVQSSYERQK